MFNKYYQQELAFLKDLAVEFSKAHPAIAPALSGPTTDPDVERLLEGVAFTTGMLRQKLDDEFPEIIHGLIDLIFPHYLRPLPSASIIAFSSKPGLQESVTVPKGATVASVPVDGTPCLFQTCFEVRTDPLLLKDARLVEQPGGATQIRLNLELTSGNLASWDTKQLRFYLGGNYTEASDLYLLLNRYIKTIVIQSEQGGRPLHLPPDCLKPVGFAPDEDLTPYPGHAFQGYRLLQEYFLLPQKFLFIDLTGLEEWRDRGSGANFDIIFELADPPFYPSRIEPQNFVLFASPIINLFEHPADPISLDHRQPAYFVRPSATDAKHYAVFAVKSVTGIVHGALKHKEYAPLELFSTPGEDRPIYQVKYKPSIIDQSVKIFLTLPYASQSGAPVQETLSLTLSCTNGTLPEHLQLGDISQPTSDSPVLLDFKNIIPCTTPVQPVLGDNTLWQFLSHLALNYLPLANTHNLKELLNLYSFPSGRDRSKVAANRKRIDGILEVRIKQADRLVNRHLMRGQEIDLDIRQDHFAGPGDMFLLGSILDFFLGVYASLNCFTRLSVRDTITGEKYLWQPRLGTRPLL